jgi:hypothetical protein
VAYALAGEARGGLVGESGAVEAVDRVDGVEFVAVFAGDLGGRPRAVGALFEQEVKDEPIDAGFLGGLVGDRLLIGHGRHTLLVSGARHGPSLRAGAVLNGSARG